MNDTPRPPASVQIGQIALTVRDLERAITFYRDALGLPFLFQAPNVAFFDAGGIRLMLGQSEVPEQSPGGTILYYRVGDLDGACAGLLNRGAEPVRGPHRVARLADHELWMAFFRDTEDNVFGLMCEKPLESTTEPAATNYRVADHDAAS